ncbi:hypothetical protein CHU98_g3872 [Xylaria longipes]|nr:hypothetical protein CHU98_g3872 [Xylaria longipes]
MSVAAPTYLVKVTAGRPISVSQHIFPSPAGRSRNMSMPPNAVVAVLVVLFIMVISLAFWKGKKVVERFAHEMFTAKRAEQQHRRQAAGSEASV